MADFSQRLHQLGCSIAQHAGAELADDRAERVTTDADDERKAKLRAIVGVEHIERLGDRRIGLIQPERGLFSGRMRGEGRTAGMLASQFWMTAQKGQLC